MFMRVLTGLTGLAPQGPQVGRGTAQVAVYKAIQTDPANREFCVTEGRIVF